MKKLMTKVLLTISLYLFGVLSAFAQTDDLPPTHDDQPSDFPAAPIDGYVWVGVLLALLLAGYLFYKRHHKLRTGS